MPRLFVAVDLPSDYPARLQTLQASDLAARWTAPDQYHITLRFVGDADADQTAQIRSRLEDIDLPSFQIGGEGLGVFPSVRKPRVLVVHINEEPGLMALQERVDDIIVTMGFDEERNPFNPHITIARLKDAAPRDVRTYLQERGEFKIEPFITERFRLYESELGSEGAVHNVLQEYPLRSPRSTP